MGVDRRAESRGGKGTGRGEGKGRGGTPPDSATDLRPWF
jgi:hypothetical protein